MDEWLTYQAAGQRLGISAEAARQRAMRGHWPRQRGNDGTALVRIPEGVTVRRRTPVEQVDERPNAPEREHPAEHPLERLVAALERHISGLQADLALARAELADERQAVAEMRANYQRLVDELLELRKASASAPPPAPPRRSAPPPPRRPAPATAEPAPAAFTREDFETKEGMAAIRKRIEARLAAREH